MDFWQRVQNEVVGNFHHLKPLCRYFGFYLIKLIGIHLLAKGLCILVNRGLVSEPSTVSADWSSKNTRYFLIAASQLSFVK